MKVACDECQVEKHLGNGVRRYQFGDRVWHLCWRCFKKKERREAMETT